MSNIIKAIKLDHEIMRSHYPLFLVAYAIGMFFGVLSKTPMFGALIVIAISAPFTGQFFQIYEKNNLDKLYGMLPLKKSDVVVSMYLFALCIALINGGMALVLGFIVSLLIHSGLTGIETLNFFSGGFFYFCFVISVIFPLYFKFPFSKVYIFSNLPFYLIFIFVLVIARANKALTQTGPVMQFFSSNQIVAAIGLGLGLTLMALSCLLSSALVARDQEISLPAEEPGKRLFFADNLRTWMVILVVLQHLGEIFGLYLFLMINQAYFMGLLFLISGYFTPGSFERKGPKKFLLDRLLRLGVPTLAYVFILRPLATWGSAQISGKPIQTLFALDQMWFVVMLLVFDLGYLAWRTLLKNRPQRPADEASMRLTFPKVALFMLALTAASYLVRIVLPYGIPVFIGTGSPWIGHGSWQSAVFALWDSIFAVGISLALITFFRRFLDGGKQFGRFLAQNSYAVYILHVPVIVFWMLVISGSQMSTLLKFALSAMVSLPVTFGLAWLVRKIPFVKKAV